MKKILIISDTSHKSVKMFLDQVPKLAKGFVRLGNDVRHLSYNNILRQLSPFKSRKLSGLLCKKKADDILADYAENYMPDIIIVSFCKCLDGNTVNRLRKAVPNVVIVGGDGDPWPKLNTGRIETAKEFDILMATNDGQWLQDYRDAGVPLCVFMPNCCDPDVDHRYDVGEEWKSDILWIGTVQHSVNTGSTFRQRLISELAKRKNARLYACMGRPKIGGMNYLYAISGARIGLSISASEPVKLYDSDRLIRLLSCGTFVLARRFPDCELLFKDGVHLKYFDTIEEFFDLANWYLEHEKERKMIADAGMKRAHEQFNSTKIAGYILELIEKRRYSAPWFEHLSTAKMNK
ncbi:MAG: glycosyltransferase family 1 protein [Sedimentisphaerales bacterium]|nr:glycosyltransferase family 1 protein [Sedimentisphaerales bacterium]